MRNVRLTVFLLFILFSTGNKLEGKNITVSLRKDISGQLVRANTNYIIKRPIDLHGETIVIPPESKLLFKRKGVIKNGNIVFQNTQLKDRSGFAFFEECSFSGQLSKGSYKISKFGVFADGEHDDAQIINQVLDCIAGYGSILIFDCDGDYGVSSPEKRQTIRIKSNTTISFKGKGFLRLLTCSDGGAVVSISGGTNNVTINNLLIDGGGYYTVGGISGQNGIGISESNNITINGGIIKNCKQGKDVHIGGRLLYGEGGKGVQIENHGATNIVVNDLIIENCSKAISSHRNHNEQGCIEASFNNIVANNCDQFAFIHQTNGEDTVGNQHRITINNFTALNCGSEDGLFIFSRTRYLTINGGMISGTINIPSVFRGRISKSVIKNISINQPCQSVIDLNPSKYGQDERKSELNYFDLSIKSNYDYLLFSDEKRVVPNRSLYHSLIRIESSLYPSMQLYSHESIVSGNVYFNVSFIDGKYYNGSVNTIEQKCMADIRKAVLNGRKNEMKKRQIIAANGIEGRGLLDKGYTMWDDKSERLIIWDSQIWRDVNGNPVVF